MILDTLRNPTSGIPYAILTALKARRPRPGATVGGLAAVVTITGAEAALDRLTGNALGGDDVVDASGLAAGAIGLTATGGEGDDALFGGAGDDTLQGNAGDDVLVGGTGLDVMDGSPGDDVVIH
jgi:Ca2+-binding RTX toxin-like protein